MRYVTFSQLSDMLRFCFLPLRLKLNYDRTVNSCLFGLVFLFVPARKTTHYSMYICM